MLTSSCTNHLVKALNHVRIFGTFCPNDSKTFVLNVKNEVVLSHHWAADDHFSIRSKGVNCKAIDLRFLSVEVLAWVPSNSAMLCMNEGKNREWCEMIFERKFLAVFSSVKLPAIFLYSCPVAFVLARLTILLDEIVNRLFLSRAHISKSCSWVHKSCCRGVWEVKISNFYLLKGDFVVGEGLIEGEPFNTLFLVRLNGLIITSNCKLTSILTQTKSEFSFIDKFGFIKNIKYWLQSCPSWSWKS